jgi:hypothetical protein
LYYGKSSETMSHRKFLNFVENLKILGRSPVDDDETLLLKKLEIAIAGGNMFYYIFDLPPYLKKFSDYAKLKLFILFYAICYIKAFKFSSHFISV